MEFDPIKALKSASRIGEYISLDRFYVKDKCGQIIPKMFI
jgi:hypothetical protein